MATNVTKTHLEFFQQQLKTQEIHLQEAIKRWEKAKITLAEKKRLNPKKFGDRPELAEESSEIINCRRKCEHFKYAIELIEKEEIRSNGIRVQLDDSRPARNSYGFKAIEPTLKVDKEKVIKYVDKKMNKKKKFKVNHKKKVKSSK